MTIVIGIDGGVNGGIVALDENQQIINAWKMPIMKMSNGNTYDTRAIINIFNELDLKNDKITVFLEQAHVRPIQGKKQCFTNGFCYGIMQGILLGMNISYEIFSPQEWQKEMLGETRGDTKEKSIQLCTKKYPAFDWKVGSKNYNDGLTDACCIALYGLRNKMGGI